MLSVMTSKSKVYLVGAGPGDPGLITVRGRDCLRGATAVVYDTLVHPALLDHAPPDAERIFVGKQTGRHSLPQEEIQRVLITQAQAGATVVRLKGGDPFVFGRGGEEARALAAAGIPFEVVPGVTAGIAVPAYAGIPVTQRGVAGSVSLITGHTRDDDTLGLGSLAREGTLVFYMGVKNLPRIVRELHAIGRRPDTPAAMISWGTCARQRTVCARLDQLDEVARTAGIEAPAIVLVGEVAHLRGALAWFEARPLHGLRVAVTHTRQRSGALDNRLRELGAEVIAVPTLAIEPADPAGDPLDPAQYDWIVLTSVNAVEMLFTLLSRRGADARRLAGVRLCVSSTPTVVEAVRARFLEPDVVPTAFGAEITRDAMVAVAPLEGRRVLMPRADIAHSSLPDVLREAGAHVDAPVAWHSTVPEGAEENVAAMLRAAPQLVVFTNAAAVRNFAHILGERLSTFAAGAAVASLGPVTSRTLTGHGLPVHVEPARPDLEHLIEAICDWRRSSSI